MKNTIIICILLFSAFFCRAQSVQSNSKLKEATLTSDIDALVKQYQDLDIFSGVVLVVEAGEPKYHKAFGWANRATRRPNSLNTKFDIGSMNKTFTKVVLLQLLEEGRLKFSDKLGKYISGFPKVAAEKITIDHLVNFTSGYGDYFTQDYFEAPASQKTIAQLVKRIKKMPLHFEPGTDNMYSNAGYVLLGAIIEKITGKSYATNVKERIVIPLELTNTYVENVDQIEDKSIGYFKKMTGEIEDNMGFLEVPKPDGGFQSTALDVSKFYQEFHYGNQLLKEKTKMKDEFYKAIQEHKNSGGAIPHTGGFEGANTVHYEILRDKISVVVLANMDEPVAEQLGKGILAIIRGKTPEAPSLPALQNVYTHFKENGIRGVEKNFEKLITNFHPTDPKDIILNAIGYELLAMDAVEDAIAIFELNTRLFPEVGNVWDSLGEAYFKKGEKQKSLKAYQTALAIDPEIPSAKEMVRKLSSN